MAAKRRFLKFFLAFTVSTLLLFILSQNSLAKVYEWEDFTQPFKRKIERFCMTKPNQIEVLLPDFLKNYESVLLIVRIDGDTANPGRPHLIINNFNRDPYRINFDQDSLIAIKTKHLRTGINRFYFHDRVPCSYGSYLRELRFDFSKMKDVKAHIDKKHAADKAAIKKPISPAQELKKDTTPPEIVITSHDTLRGIRPIQNQKKVRISGKAYDENGIVEITVNNKDASFDEAGNFETAVYLKMGNNRIVVSAMDIYENRANKEFTITRIASKRPSKVKIAEATAGNYYALVIGNNNYKYLRRLETAQNDARKVAETLKLRYGFDTNLLLDADRDAILDAINNFRRILKQDDQFLIYYAGHGSFDKIAGKAYWLPVDAQRNNDKNWIIVDTITSNIKRISSNHVLIIADSCYSGTFTRTSSLAKLESAQKRKVYLKKMQAKKSRTLLASGGNEPVSDIGGEGHSVFAKAFLVGLTNMDLNGFTAEELYIQYIKEMVAGSSEQTPEYNIIRNSGHEGGDFVFRKKLASVEQEKSREDEKIKITLDKMEIADDYPADIRKIVHPDKKLPKPKSGYIYAFCLITVNKIKNVHVVNLEDSILISEEPNNYKSIMSVTTGINFIKYSLRYVVTEGAKIVYVFLIPQHAKPDKLSFVYYFKNQLKDSSIKKGKIEIQL